MNRQQFLRLAAGTLLLPAACQPAADAPAPGPSARPVPGTLLLRLDLTQELLAVGSSRQDAAGLVFVRRVAPGNLATSFQQFSLICPHAGCLVAAQAATGGFACPCHGSRFGPDGAVLAGPAARPLDQFVLRLEGNWLLISSQ